SAGWSPGAGHRWPALALAAVSGLIGYLAGTPFTLLDFERFVGEFATQAGYGANRWLGQPPDPVPLLYVTNLLQGFGAVPLGLALLGLLLVWRASRAGSVVLCAFPAAYLLFLLPKSVFFARLVIPLLPFVSLLAGVAVAGLVCRLRPSWRPAGLLVLLTVALAQPLVFDLLHNRIVTQL